MQKNRYNGLEALSKKTRISEASTILSMGLSIGINYPIYGSIGIGISRPFSLGLIVQSFGSSFLSANPRMCKALVIDAFQNAFLNTIPLRGLIQVIN